jgi:hypothetical protein
MRAAARLLIITLVAAAVSTADPPGSSLWKAGDLRRHDTALATHVADDHSSRETLADYGDHRFGMIYRNADGDPEPHDAIIDIGYVHSGGGTLVIGGTMAGRRRTTAGEHVGTRLDGGERHPLGPEISSTSRPAFPTASSCPAASTSPTCS